MNKEVKVWRETQRLAMTAFHEAAILTTLYL
jgi:hypothetical protein